MTLQIKMSKIIGFLQPNMYKSYNRSLCKYREYQYILFTVSIKSEMYPPPVAWHFTKGRNQFRFLNVIDKYYTWMYKTEIFASKKKSEVYYCNNYISRAWILIMVTKSIACWQAPPLYLQVPLSSHGAASGVSCAWEVLQRSIFDPVCVASLLVRRES